MTPTNLPRIGLNHRRIHNGSLRKESLPGRIWHGLGGNSLGAMAIKKMTPVGSDSLIATGPIKLPEQRVEHIGLTKEWAINACIYLLR